MYENRTRTFRGAEIYRAYQGIRTVFAVPCFVHDAVVLTFYCQGGMAGPN